MRRVGSVQLEPSQTNAVASPPRAPFPRCPSAESLPRITYPKTLADGVYRGGSKRTRSPNRLIGLQESNPRLGAKKTCDARLFAAIFDCPPSCRHELLKTVLSCDVKSGRQLTSTPRRTLANTHSRRIRATNKCRFAQPAPVEYRP